MKYLNHFNKHLGRGDRLPYSERESGNSDANAFFFNCHSGQFVVNSEKKKLQLMLLVANSFSRRLMQM